MFDLSEVAELSNMLLEPVEPTKCLSQLYRLKQISHFYIIPTEHHYDNITPNHSTNWANKRINVTSLILLDTAH